LQLASLSTVTNSAEELAQLLHWLMPQNIATHTAGRSILHFAMVKKSAAALQEVL